jgi:transposase InsO family protein
MGAAGVEDRSSRPHLSPTKTSQKVVRKIGLLRWKQRLGPVGIAVELGMPASTVHAVLVRMRINKLHHIDKRTGEVVRRYEHPYPGSMIHVDVTKFGNIPDGGGHRFVGRRQCIRNRLATVGAPQSKNHDPNLGKAFVHTVVDDHSRVAYAEIHGDETAVTAVGVLKRAVSWFAARGVIVERVLSDNGSAYRSHCWRDSCAELGITPKKTRPYRPQANGKIERSHRTLADGGRFDGCIPPKRPGATPYRDGCMNTITTGPIRPSEETHPSAGQRTCPGRTVRPGLPARHERHGERADDQ